MYVHAHTQTLAGLRHTRNKVLRKFEHCSDNYGETNLNLFMILRCEILARDFLQEIK